jgi:hypothetical protein
MPKILAIAMLLIALAGTGCGDDDDMTGGSSGMGNEAGSGGGESTDDQIPPMGEEALEAWLATGAFEDWHCERETHEARSPSPHGFNRVCSNDMIAENIAGDDPWPKGAAAVKLLYDSIASEEPLGYAVYLKKDEDSAGGDNWYWYERIGERIYADGDGDEPGIKAGCVGCHSVAGDDAEHTPSEGGRDLVYTPVP